MTEFQREELKEIILDSYNLILTLPSLQLNKRKEWEIKSRSKLRTLPEALREFQDPSASITHFVKNTAYFLPRAERGSGTDKTFNELLSKLLDTVSKYSKRTDSPEHIRQKLVYLIGYLNWGSDSICVLKNVSHNDQREFERRLKAMLFAEFRIVGADSEVEKMVQAIKGWAFGQMEHKG
ncbi:MAG: hypothetical protein A4E35_00830 [Methanoregula sp. PtaU1.Bin051]|nr:MAG: hypothetical protein A4E35_00830 [Methanoregula sp. PtaU1.Bin051]